ncbi:hypothetical protein MFLAVUS_001130 [Mucor flavus]|uniref:Uncharacterized protein n=1 Tax=Mucor flavus TaxID=439312 RepID=A0ABP9YLL8_9FUNG
MENAYNIRQHSHCFQHYQRFEAIISCDKQKTRALAYGSRDDNADSITIDNIKQGLYRVFEKGKEKWDDDDKFFMKVVSGYILGISGVHKDYECLDQVHYAFIVPSEWKKEISEELIRPIYIEAGLISEKDHSDRLLFISEVECIFYDLQKQHLHFERGQYTVLSRVNTSLNNVVTIKLDLVRTMSTLFNCPGSKFVPYVEKSRIISITPHYFSDEITAFIKTKTAVFTAKNDPAVHSLVQDLYENMGKLIVSMNNLAEYTNGSIETFEIFQNYDDSVESRIKTEKLIDDVLKTMAQNNFVRNYRFVTLTDKRGENFGKNYALNNLIESTLARNTLTTDRKSHVASLDYISDNEPSRLFRGAALGAFETIKNCSMHCTPNIRREEKPVISLSTIINIDISRKSTLLSFSVLNDNGDIESIYDHNHIETNNSLLSICETWITMPFDKKEHIFNLTFTDQEPLRGEEFILNIEQILKDSSKKKMVISVSQQRYIKNYVLEYLVYVKDAILSIISNADDKNVNIGYAVSIEKIMLENIIGTKKDLQEVMYASGLINKSDGSKKLVVITQGEVLIPVIKRHVKLDFPLNTYFVLAQLHEDYIQLTLNRVVTNCSVEEKESVVMQEEIIPIKNIYKSLCINMWENIVEESSLIQLCDEHKTCNDSEICQLFSMGNRNKFMEDFERFISGNIFKENSDVEITDKHVIEFSSTCECKVYLTIYDFIHVSLEPVLRDIAITLSASLKINELFGNYIYIKYAFSLIYFNQNLKLQPIIQKILSDKTKIFNIEEGIETECSVISEPSNYFLLPNIEQQLFLSRRLQIGTLQQVSSQSYCFQVSSETFFRIIGSGDIMDSHKFNHANFVKIPKDSTNDTIVILLTCYYYN